MNLTEDNFDKLWTEWQKSPVAPGTYAETFRRWLGTALRTEFTETEHASRWVVWSSPRTVPAGLLVKRTIIAAVLPNAPDSRRTFLEVRSCAGNGDILLLVLVGASDIYRAYAKQSLSVPVVALFRDDVRRVLFAESANPILRDILRKQVGMDHLNPYHHSGPVGGAMFFGREEEIRRLTRSGAQATALVGQRGVGKSSLLVESVRRLRTEPGVHVVYIDCEEYQTCVALENALSARIFPQSASSKVFYGIDDLAGRTADRLYLFLDEADHIVRLCDGSPAEATFYGRLKAAVGATQKPVIVFAGWHELWDAINNPVHTVRNVLEETRLKPLSIDEAKSLILRPLESLGLTIEKPEEVVSAVANWSSRHPAYIQLVCRHLVERASSTGRSTVALEDVHRVIADEEVYDAIIDPFVQAVPKLEKCLAFAATHLPESFGVLELRDELRSRRGVVASPDVLARASDRLVVYNVFAREGQGYRFLVRDFPKMLRERQPVDELLGSLLHEVEGKLRGAE